MPFYTYKCNKCDNKVTKKLSVNEDKPHECDKCDGSLYRDYSSISCDTNVERRDPNHNNYWKNGKTVDQIANVLENKENPY